MGKEGTRSRLDAAEKLGLAMTPDETKAARALCEAATRGPWIVERDADACEAVHGAGGVITCIVEDPRDKADAAFIAAARTGWPAALDEIKRLRAALTEYEAEPAHAFRVLTRALSEREATISHTWEKVRASGIGLHSTDLSDAVAQIAQVAVSSRDNVDRAMVVIAEHEATIARLREALFEIERHCPCGARPESLATHPHVSPCPVAKALAESAPRAALDATIADARRDAAEKMREKCAQVATTMAKETDSLSVRQLGPPIKSRGDDRRAVLQLVADAIRGARDVAQAESDMETTE